MNSSRLKWFLIAIFLAANIFFLIQYKSHSDKLSNYTQKEIDTAVEILNSRGINVTASAIPSNKTVDPVLKLDYSEDRIEHLAEHIMNDSFASYMLPAGISYTNDRETLIFYDSYSFEYTVKNAVIPDETVFEQLETAEADESMRTYVKALLNKLFYQSFTDSYRMSLKLLSALQTEDTVLIRVQQEINGTPIDLSEITAVFKGKEIQLIRGNIFLSDSVSKLSADSLDVINLLFKIDCSEEEISKIDKIYYPVTTESGSLYLTPSYMLTYASSEVHVWDATSSAQRY